MSDLRKILQQVYDLANHNCIGCKDDECGAASARETLYEDTIPKALSNHNEAEQKETDHE